MVGRNIQTFPTLLVTSMIVVMTASPLAIAANSIPEAKPIIRKLDKVPEIFRGKYIAVETGVSRPEFCDGLAGATFVYDTTMVAFGEDFCKIKNIVETRSRNPDDYKIALDCLWSGEGTSPKHRKEVWRIRRIYDHKVFLQESTDGIALWEACNK